MMRLLLLAGLVFAESLFPQADSDLEASGDQLMSMRAAFTAKPADRKSKTWAKAELYELRDEDVFLRGRFNVPFESGYQPDELKYYMQKFDKQLIALDRIDAEELKRLLAIHGWPKISTWGKKADEAAWLIAQHADHDIPFQKEVLKTLEGLAAKKETNPANFAFLADRVAIHEDRPQLYGTQGGCQEAGRWEADPIDDPINLDERRAKFGLP